MGHEVRSLGLAEMGVLIGGVIRGETEIVPQGGTKLRVRDDLLVATKSEAIERFRAMIARQRRPMKRYPDKTRLVRAVKDYD